MPCLLAVPGRPLGQGAPHTLGQSWKQKPLPSCCRPGFPELLASRQPLSLFKFLSCLGNRAVFFCGNGNFGPSGEWLQGYERLWSECRLAGLCLLQPAQACSTAPGFAQGKRCLGRVTSAEFEGIHHSAKKNSVPSFLWWQVTILQL